MPIETPTAGLPARLSLTAVPDPRAAETFADAVRSGLGARPKTLPCRYFYDEAGSRLFEQICDLPEYYPTRTEDAILAEHADAMVAGLPRDPTLVELGSGSSSKTRRLIEAALAAYFKVRYIPIDVSAEILEDSARHLVARYPGLRVSAWAGQYEVALADLAAKLRGPKLILFLGSSLGNYAEPEAVGLLRQVAAAMTRNDRFLLGTDLVKDPADLQAAYDDAQGITAAFNRNILARINRELGADFDPDRFAHRARYVPGLERVEMHLESLDVQVVTIPEADLSVRFARGETIHTESSHKYTPARLAHLARRAGFVEEAAWTDARGAFRVQRWRLSAD